MIRTVICLSSSGLKKEGGGALIKGGALNTEITVNQIVWHIKTPKKTSYHGGTIGTLGGALKEGLLRDSADVSHTPEIDERIHQIPIGFHQKPITCQQTNLLEEWKVVACVNESDIDNK